MTNPARKNGGKITVLIIFTGSLFLTSGQFVNSANAPKFYFVAVAFAIVLAITAIKAKRTIAIDQSATTLAMKGIFWVCLLQAVYGLLQYGDVFPSNHSRFSITGSFDNPAGFAAVLSLAFPLGLYFLVQASKRAKYFYVAALAIICISVILAGSRTGMLAILASGAFFFLHYLHVPKKIRQTRYGRVLRLLPILIFIPVVLSLYQLNKDSSNGRMLIWRVSLDMVRDKPFLGHGYGMFRAKYMDYQAHYFAGNPDSPYSNLADNVKHPFNELIKIAVEFGLTGLMTFLLIILWLVRKTGRSKSKESIVFLSGLLAFGVWAFLSYPLHYVTVWVLLFFYLLWQYPPSFNVIQTQPFSIVVRVLLFAGCVFYIIHTISQVQAEIRWKEVAQNSLHRQTATMLPEYRKLYPVLKSNPFFLYNYAAELNIADQYDKSLEILDECLTRFNDYDVQLLKADNHCHLGDTAQALNVYEHASSMVPCRFWPLYRRFQIYREKGREGLAQTMAKQILRKEVKVPSYTIQTIKKEAREYIRQFPNQRGKVFTGNLQREQVLLQFF